jgi:hypothetical protein
MSSDKDDQVVGGEASADYMISESGKQQEEALETTKGKKSSGLSSVTDTIKEKVKDAKDKVVETKDKVTDTTREKVKDAKDKVVETKDKVTDTKKETIGRTDATAETKVPSKNDSTREYGSKEPMSPEKIMEHEPTAVKREMTEKITDGGETSTDSEEAREIVRKRDMAKGVAGADETDDEYK